MPLSQGRLRDVLGEARSDEFALNQCIRIPSRLCPERVYQLDDDGTIWFVDPCDAEDVEYWLCIGEVDTAGFFLRLGTDEDLILKYLLITTDELRLLATANIQEAPGGHWAWAYQRIAKDRLQELADGIAHDRDAPLGELRRGYSLSLTQTRQSWRLRRKLKLFFYQEEMVFAEQGWL